MTKEAQSVVYTDCMSAEWSDCPNKSLGYDIKQSDGEVAVILELWEMQSNPLLPLLPRPLWSGVVAPDWVLSMGQI